MGQLSFKAYCEAAVKSQALEHTGPAGQYISISKPTTPEQFEANLLHDAASFGIDGWDIGPDDVKFVGDEAKDEYNVIYLGWLKRPLQPNGYLQETIDWWNAEQVRLPVVVVPPPSPFAFDYGDGTFMASAASNPNQRKINETIQWEGATYYFFRGNSGILTGFPKWANQEAHDRMTAAIS